MGTVLVFSAIQRAFIRLYMLNMVRDYDLPGDYALNEESVEMFISYANKPDSQRIQKISWLESHQSTYEKFGSYWLELAKDYYEEQDYEKCLMAVHQYESIATRIFRKDIDYAKVLPMAIISSKETMSQKEYSDFAAIYCTLTIREESRENREWKSREWLRLQSWNC